MRIKKAFSEKPHNDQCKPFILHHFKDKVLFDKVLRLLKGDVSTDVTGKSISQSELLRLQILRKGEFKKITAALHSVREELGGGGVSKFTCVELFLNLQERCQRVLIYFHADLTLVFDAALMLF